ncbi:hypothetical protein Tco_1300308, partial [Tanacetum coccineum]
AEQVVYGDHGQVCSHGILFPPEAVIVWNLSTLIESDVVEEVEGPTQADSYEVDNYDVDSGSLNEQVENSTDPLINLSDVGKSQKDVIASEQNEFGELMSKGALESWLDVNPISSQNISGIDNERLSSARLSIRGAGARGDQNLMGCEMANKLFYGTRLKIWDAITGEVIYRHIKHEKRAWSVDFS